MFIFDYIIFLLQNNIIIKFGFENIEFGFIKNIDNIENIY